MYGGATWLIGHAGVGATQLGTAWRFTEGVNDDAAESYLLLGNPNGSAAAVTLTFTKTDGTVVTSSTSIPGVGRTTVSLKDIPGLETGIVPNGGDVDQRGLVRRGARHVLDGRRRGTVDARGGDERRRTRRGEGAGARASKPLRAGHLPRRRAAETVIEVAARAWRGVSRSVVPTPRARTSVHR